MLTVMNNCNSQLEGILNDLQAIFKKQYRGDQKSKEKPKGLSERVEHILKEKKSNNKK